VKLPAPAYRQAGTRRGLTGHWPVKGKIEEFLASLSTGGDNPGRGEPS